MKVNRMWLAISFMSLFLADVSHALGPVEFGPEFTFANSNVSILEAMPLLSNRMNQHLVLGQIDGEKFETENLLETQTYLNEFRSPNGWWFRIAYEGGPAGVVEVKMKHGSVEYFREFKDDMQDAIFVSAANEKLFPALFRGGGHINLSTAAFEGNFLLLRNFLVDLLNHNELFMGVFNYDTHNALPFQVNSEASKKAVRKVIRDFDTGQYKINGGFPEQNRFMKDWQTAQNTAKDEFLENWRGAIVSDVTWTDDFAGIIEPPELVRAKYHAVNLSHIVENRIEIRGVRPQASMDVWIRQINLIHHRLKYLETIKTPIPIKTSVPVQKIDVAGKRHDLNPPVDSQLALRAFYRYVTESGLRWQDHTDYLWPKWVSDGEVEKFEKSFWFRWKESRQPCGDALLAGNEWF